MIYSAQSSFYHCIKWDQEEKKNISFLGRVCRTEVKVCLSTFTAESVLELLPLSMAGKEREHSTEGDFRVNIDFRIQQH